MEKERKERRENKRGNKEWGRGEKRERKRETDKESRKNMKKGERESKGGEKEREEGVREKRERRGERESVKVQTNYSSEQVHCQSEPIVSSPGNAGKKPNTLYIVNVTGAAAWSRLSCFPPLSPDTRGSSAASSTTDLPRLMSRSSARFGSLSHHSFFSRHNPHPIRVRHIQGTNALCLGRLKEG
ncbi:hypothetical protein WMY93_017242 [Mugilogobius chulae]|uniref:Uncharacterized protein n=1 Tax=Mugilogobius chulae TaxID=88201 RepID=A0AAW0NMP5_9GOBI